jgi:hypothetical protein
VIQEAGLHGVRALVADTLSDGIDVIKDNPLLGSVIQQTSILGFISGTVICCLMWIESSQRG